MVQEKNGTRSARVIFWGCGYSFIISQWLSNGSFGSSWLPDFSQLGHLSTVGQLSVYLTYFVLLIIVGVRVARHISPINNRTILMTSGVLVIMGGDLLTFFSGSGFFAAELYVVGMILIGFGMTVVMLGWAEFYCLIGARNACIALALCFIVGSCIFSLLGCISSLSLPVAIIVQLCLLPISLIMLTKGYRQVNASNAEEALPVEKPFPHFNFKALVPYYLVVLVLGLVLGIIIGLNSAQETATPISVWTIGMSATGLLVLFGVLGTRHFSLDNLSKTLTPVLIICALLIPALLHNYFELVCIFGCAGYVLARIFYQVAYVSIAQTRKVPIIPLVACAIAADSLGIIIGEVLCATVIPRQNFPIDTVYVIVLVAVGAIVLVSSFFLREKNIISLWGVKPSEFSDEAVEKRCMQIAIEYNLTFRETEVLIALAKGLMVEDIAQDMNITVKTLRTHSRNIYAKLDVHSQPELIRRVVFSDHEEPLT